MRERGMSEQQYVRVEDGRGSQVGRLQPDGSVEVVLQFRWPKPDDQEDKIWMTGVAVLATKRLNGEEVLPHLPASRFVLVRSGSVNRSIATYTPDGLLRTVADVVIDTTPVDWTAQLEDFAVELIGALSPQQVPVS
jgi:hypothetical protein